MPAKAGIHVLLLQCRKHKRGSSPVGEDDAVFKCIPSYSFVMPAKAGIHVLLFGISGCRFRGNDEEQKLLDPRPSDAALKCVRSYSFVMPGLAPGIHVLLLCGVEEQKHVDSRPPPNGGSCSK